MGCRSCLLRAKRKTEITALSHDYDTEGLLLAMFVLLSKTQS